jgi:hypothetical protein
VCVGRVFYGTIIPLHTPSIREGLSILVTERPSSRARGCLKLLPRGPPILSKRYTQSWGQGSSLPIAQRDRDSFRVPPDKSGNRPRHAGPSHPLNRTILRIALALTR